MMVPPYQRGGVSMIPGTFAPSVSDEAMPMVPASAPGVRPMQNAAPGQLEQTGAMLAQTGAIETRLGNTIVDGMQEAFNVANVRNAQTSFLNTANDIATRYTHALGMDAINGYEPAKQALLKAKQDAETGLTNPVQRQMFAQVATPHLVEFGKQLSDHQFEQHIQYGTQAANDSADTFVQQAANSYADWQRPEGKFARNKAIAIQQAQAAARLLGAPADSPQSQAMVKQKTTALAQGVVTRMMNKEQYPEAQQYLDQFKDEIDERTYETLSNAVMEGHVSQKGKNLAQQQEQTTLGGGDGSQQRLQPVTIGSITSTMGGPRPGGRVHDGIDIAVPVGTNVQAPANGTVSKVWNDDKFGGGLSMEITYPNGYTEGFAHLEAVNYKPGQQVTQGSVVALTGKTGDATGPVLHWAMKDKDGNWVDPRSVAPAPQNPENFTTPEQLEKAIAGVNASDNIQRVKDVAISQLKTDYSTARTIQDQKYQETKQNALDYYYSHNYSLDGYPAAQRMLLKPQDLDALTQAPPKQDDFTKVFGFLSAEPKDQTMANLNAIAGSLTAKTYKELAMKVLNRQNEVENFPPANVPSDMFTDALRIGGFNNLVNAKDPNDQKRFSQLRTSIEQVATGEEQVLNRKLKPEEWQKIINDTLTQHVFVEHGHLFPGIGVQASGDTDVPMVLPRLYGRHYGVDTPLAGVPEPFLPRTYVMSGAKKVYLADIPAKARAAYTAQLVMANSNLPANKQLPITEQAIADAWVAHGMPKE